MNTARAMVLLISPIGIIWLITQGGGGWQNWRWVLRIKLEIGEDCFQSVLNIHTPLSSNLTPIILFARIRLSSQKQFLCGINIEVGGPSALPPKLRLWFHRQTLHKSPDFVNKTRKWRFLMSDESVLTLHPHWPSFYYLQHSRYQARNGGSTSPTHCSSLQCLPTSQRMAK